MRINPFKRKQRKLMSYIYIDEASEITNDMLEAYKRAFENSVWETTAWSWHSHTRHLSPMPLPRSLEFATIMELRKYNLEYKQIHFDGSFAFVK